MTPTMTPTMIPTVIPTMTGTRKPHRSKQAGFTLLEVLVSVAIMGIAVAGVMSGLATASRNAARLTDYDRATLLAQQKMDELLADRFSPHNRPMNGIFSPNLTGGVQAGWNARIMPFESAIEMLSPGLTVVDRIELEIWWMDGPTRRNLMVEGFRRGQLQPGEF